jgi:hypothetical protein
MNWTGGRLARHSNTKGALNARQKAHFAKVQAGLRGGQAGTKKPSPLKPSIFGIAGDHYHSSARPPYHHGESHNIRQGTPRDTYRQPESAPRDSHPWSYISSREHPSQIKRESTCGSREDLYDATPQPVELKRKCKPSVLPTVKGAGLDSEEDSMSEKRRRILGKMDWVGTSIHRPMQITFTSPKDDDKVGRRRKILNGHRARYKSKQTMLESPFMSRTRLYSQYPQYEKRQERGYQGRADVRISIGGRAVPPGISSSSAPSKLREYSARSQVLEESQRTSSDVMLLDSDKVSRDTGKSLSGGRSGSYENPNLVPEEEKTSSSVFPGADIEEYGRVRRQRSEDRERARKRRKGFGPNLSDLPYTSPAKKRKHDHFSKSQEEVRDTQQASPIFSSSSAVLQHPKPVGFNVSTLLRSRSRDIAESTVAQVGGLRRLYSSSQVLDNELWETWAAPQLNSESPKGSEIYRSQMQHRGVSISPGVSQAPLLLSRASDRVLSDHSNVRLSPDRRHAVYLKYQCSPDPYSSTTLRSSYGNETVAQKDLRCRKLLEDSKGFYGSRDHNKPQKEICRVDIAPQKIQTLKTPKEPSPDPDEAWKRFVFGRSSSQGPEPVDCNDHRPGQVPPVGQHASSPSSITPKLPAEISNNPHYVAGFQRSITPERVSSAPTHTDSGQSTPSDLRQLISQFPTDSHRPSERTFRRFSSSPDLAPASMIVAPDSSSDLPTVGENTSQTGRKKRILFMKPKAFVGIKANMKSPDDEEDHIYIGRRTLDEEDHISRGRKRERDIYSLVGTDEIESIEDD